VKLGLLSDPAELSQHPASNNKSELGLFALETIHRDWGDEGARGAQTEWLHVRLGANPMPLVKWRWSAKGGSGPDIASSITLAQSSLRIRDAAGGGGGRVPSLSQSVALSCIANSGTPTRMILLATCVSILDDQMRFRPREGFIMG
jgi:hypothetical protein